MNKELITTVFQKILENPEFDEKLIGMYFSKDYIQHVDGKTLDYTGFVQHMKALKNAVSQLQITIRSMASEEDVVFTNHVAKIYKKDGKQGEGEVIAEFRIKDQQIIYCNELTRIIKGSEEDSDIGSRI